MSDSVGKRVAAYRRRRGMSQAALAGLVGRSESWLSQVERGVRSVDKMSVLLDMSRVLDVEVQALTGTSWQLAPNGGSRADGLASIRGVLNRYANLIEDDVPAPSPSSLRSTASSLHQQYQAAKYATVVRELPTLIGQADSALLNASPVSS